MSLERFDTSVQPNLLHHHLMDGKVFAEPYVSPITGAASMKIIEWNFDSGREETIAAKALKGVYRSVHEIPMAVMDAVWGERFMNGHRYERIGNWDWPFFGQRLGAWVCQTNPTNPTNQGDE